MNQTSISNDTLAQTQAFPPPTVPTGQNVPPGQRISTAPTVQTVRPVRPPARPGDAPTRERKLSPAAYEQIDVARSLIKAQPLPQKRAGKIVFARDDTPADAEERLGFNRPPGSSGSAGVVKRKEPGPTPQAAPAAEHTRGAEIRAARAAITPNNATIGGFGTAAPDLNGAFTAPSDNTATGPTLGDAEMEQIVALVQQRYGPILDISQASEVSKLAKQTIRERVCHGLYASSVVRGRPLRFWAHRFVKEVMAP